MKKTLKVLISFLMGLKALRALKPGRYFAKLESVSVSKKGNLSVTFSEVKRL